MCINFVALCSGFTDNDSTDGLNYSIIMHGLCVVLVSDRLVRLNFKTNHVNQTIYQMFGKCLNNLSDLTLNCQFIVFKFLSMHEY